MAGGKYLSASRAPMFSLGLAYIGPRAAKLKVGSLVRLATTTINLLSLEKKQFLLYLPIFSP